MTSHKFTLNLTGALAVTLCATVAHAASGYLADNTGSVVSSNYGECVKTGSWTAELSSPACDADLAARLEAERLAAENARLAENLDDLESPAAIAKPVTVRLSDTENVMFEFNSAVLTPAATSELERVLARIGDYEAVESIEVVGHTDSSGPDSYNQSLSVRRAASVGDFLTSKGVNRRLMSTAGKGESSPVADNATREGRAMNRRVEILISGSTVE